MLRNPNIAKLESDHLYHFALDSQQHDLVAMFGDVRYVLMGGSPRRMERTAHFLLKELEVALPTGYDLTNIASATDRYALYKVGPILLASHGMGMPSASIMLHEMIKLVYHAGCMKDVTFIRIGTCGGLGLDPGTIIVSEEAVDGMLEPHQEMAILGRKVRRPAIMDKALAKELLSLHREDDSFKVVLGKTMCTDDFYEGQGRLDGAFCDFTEEDKMAFLQEAYRRGVRNIEMESLCFAAMCHHAGIKSAVVCVAIVNRFEGDQVTTSKDTLTEWEWNPARLVARLIKKQRGDVPFTL